MEPGFPRAVPRRPAGLYVYGEAGDNIRLTLVTIDKAQAAIIRATFSPERLVEFTNDPKIFGMSLGDKKVPAAPVDKPADATLEKQGN